jgi:hypothetical protein
MNQLCEAEVARKDERRIQMASSIAGEAALRTHATMPQRSTDKELERLT